VAQPRGVGHWLGKVSLRYVESVKVKIEDLVSASITSHAPTDETSRWIASLDAKLYDKLASVGLAKAREVATLGAFTRSYIDGRVDIKPRTKEILELARKYMLECFEGNRSLRNFTAGDAEDYRLHLIGRGLSDNTVRRAIGQARQFCKAAEKRGLIHGNPFEGLAAAVRANHERFYFVSRDEAQKVLNHCPDAQWRLIFALARYGGLRCPSEILSLKWEDVNWEHNRIRVPSPKTEHHEGGASRMIPLFPELRPPLLEVFEQAEPGTEHVISRYRDSNANLRTQLHRIIRRAGLEPWPKTFQNLRSTRETELAETFPMHVVCKWIGNSQPVAAQHYLQLTDEHFERAVNSDDKSKAAQKAAQKVHEVTRNEPKPQQIKIAQAYEDSSGCAKIPVASGTFESGTMRPAGVEPATF